MSAEGFIEMQTNLPLDHTADLISSHNNEPLSEGFLFERGLLVSPNQPRSLELHRRRLLCLMWHLPPHDGPLSAALIPVAPGAQSRVFKLRNCKCDRNCIWCNERASDPVFDHFCRVWRHLANMVDSIFRNGFHPVRKNNLEIPQTRSSYDFLLHKIQLFHFP